MEKGYWIVVYELYHKGNLVVQTENFTNKEQAIKFQKAVSNSSDIWSAEVIECLEIK